MPITLTFSWFTHPGFPDWALCESDRLLDDGSSPLACLLMDDAGLNLDSTAAFIEEALSALDAIATGAMTRFVWDREDWGSQFTVSEVLIYSMHVDGHSETVPPAGFQRALKAWLAFITATSRADGPVQITL